MVRRILLLSFILSLLLSTGCGDDDNQQIRGFWKKFTKTVKAGNFERFKEISLPRIDCRVCVENSAEEDSLVANFRAENPDSWNDKAYGQLQFIPVDKFIQDDFDLLFDKPLIKKMGKTSNVSFISRDFTKEEGQQYLDDYLEAGKKHVLHEVLITTQKPTTQYEGAQVVIQILETVKGLKFYGYSNIP